MKSKIWWIILPLLVVGSARFSHQQTAGFRISKIRDNQIEGKKWPSHSYSESDQKTIDTILSRPFSYLGRGVQTFAFLSNDGNYVLKIFNNGPKRKSSWLKRIPLNRAKEKSVLFDRKYETWLESAELSFDEMQKETGLIYIHLNRTEHTLPHAQLIDRLLICHTIDLNKTAFVIQKRAQLVYPSLLSLRAREQNDIAKEQIRALLNLIEQRFSKGISDSDPLIRTNFGFVEGSPIQIDIGPFAKNNCVKDPLFFKNEMIRICQSMKEWISTHYPELSSFVEEEVQRRYAPTHSQSVKVCNE